MRPFEALLQIFQTFQTFRKRYVPFVLIALILTGIMLFSGCGAQEPPVVIDVNARSAVIMEVRSGEVLFEKNPDERLQPASIVKVMTAMVAMDNMSLRKAIVPTDTVYNVEPTVIGLKPGVKYRLRDLIRAILIKSANDAAVVIAEGVGGNQAVFVDMMNEKARKIGMENTNFTSPSGLPADPKSAQYITAMDAARMMRHAAKYNYIIDSMSMSRGEITGSDKVEIKFSTHNKSLYTENGASWGKTGYTIRARRTFVGVDPSNRPKIVIALLKSNDLWDDIAALKNGGLQLYERRHRNIFTALFKRIFRKEQDEK